MSAFCVYFMPPLFLAALHLMINAKGICSFQLGQFGFFPLYNTLYSDSERGYKID